MSSYVFFKFRNIDKYLIDSLVKGYLYFAHPDHLNDPFDCRVDIKRSAHDATSKLYGSKKANLAKLAGLEGYFDQIQKDTGKAGICSFSLELENSVLWSHYASEHRGVCLTYDFPESFLVDETNEIIGVAPVEYEENPLTEWFIEYAPENGNSDFKEFTLEVIKKVLTIKSKCWNYEKEVRIIRQEQSTLTIPKVFLKQVCFGLNTPESDISLVRALIDSSGYKVSYCKMERTECDFGLKAVEMTEETKGPTQLTKPT